MTLELPRLPHSHDDIEYFRRPSSEAKAACELLLIWYLFDNGTFLSVISIICTPLSVESRKIRIIIVLPGEFESRIACKLSVVFLDHKPYYEALSYVCGDPPNPVSIEVDGEPLQVSQSCEVALQHLRDPVKERVLWIDAICINQNCLDEKHSQIPYVGAIHSGTAVCLAGMGMESPDTKLAVGQP